MEQTKKKKRKINQFTKKVMWIENKKREDEKRKKTRRLKYIPHKEFLKSNKAENIADIELKYIWLRNRHTGQFERFLNSQALGVNLNAVKMQLKRLKDKGIKTPLEIFLGRLRLIAWDNKNEQLQVFANYLVDAQERASKKKPKKKKLEDTAAIKYIADEIDIIGLENLEKK